ncbi:MAG TPA: radical SAM protein [Spirochaetota bacterium]|nr:radical SAM protein [Spirochaetota bacterium]
MNICLVNPPIEDFYTTGIRRQPLGLLYIASALKSAGYTTSLLNCHTKKRSVMEMPAEFSYLKEFMYPRSACSFPFANYTHFGMSRQEIEKRIKESRADIYLVSSMFTTYFEETVQIFAIIKKHHPCAVIAAGGHHASLHPVHLLENGADFVIYGEGEVPSVMLARMIEHGGSPEAVPNLCWMEQGTVKTSNTKIIPDISTLNIPDRRLLSPASMWGHGKIFTTMIASRGCPNRCGFCTSRIVWGNSYRKRECGEIISEINSCVLDYGARIINFEDDNLFPSRERAVALLGALINERDKHPFYPEFTAMNGISIEKLDEEIILLMKRAGFRELDISLVSRSPEVQRKESRPFSSDQFMRIAQYALSCGFNVRGYFILGLPGQSVAEADDTISFMKKSGISVYPSVYYNVFAPQTEWKIQRSSAFFNERDDFPRHDLVRCFNRCRAEF